MDYGLWMVLWGASISNGELTFRTDIARHFQVFAFFISSHSRSENEFYRYNKRNKLSCQSNGWEDAEPGNVIFRWKSTIKSLFASKTSYTQNISESDGYWYYYSSSCMFVACALTHSYGSSIGLLTMYAWSASAHAMNVQDDLMNHPILCKIHCWYAH